MTSRRTPPAALHAGKVEASLAPDFGAALLSLTFGGENALRPAASMEAVAADRRNAACFPCVPWFGRLFGGLDVDGAHIGLAPTLPACDPVHPLHGEGWVSGWGIASHTDDYLDCRFQSDGAGRGRFPFPYEARQIAQIVGEAFELDLSVRNLGAAQAMPAGLGLHPYFPRLPGAELQFEARELWRPSPNGGGAREPLPAAFDFSGGRPLPDADFDCSFTGFAGKAEIRAGASVLRLETDAPILHLFAPAGADFFCLEPVTHPPGAFGEDRLAPGETLRLKMTIAASA